MQHFSLNSIGFLTMFVWMFGVWSADALGEQLARLEPPTGADWFGFATATDGEYVVVGDLSFDNTISQTGGAAIVYRRDGTEWVQDSMLIPDTTYYELQLYGYSIAIDQDIIVVGAYFDMSVCDPIRDCGMGSANVFRREAGGWVFEAKLFPSGIPEHTRFGSFVSLSDGRALVDAPGDINEAGQERGALYVFRREGTDWVEEARLAPSDVSDGSALHFPGRAQAIDGERLLIGATTSDGAGAAYVFRRVGTTWTEEAKLVPPDPANGDIFESSVDLSGDVAVVAGKESNAYVYRLSAGAWSYDGTLSNLDIVPNSDAQRARVNTDGLNVLVATTSANSANPPASTISIYQRNDSGWARVSILEPTDDIIVANGGAPTDMNGGLVTIGARLTGETFDYSTSSAYIFSAPGPAPAVPAVTPWGVVIMALMLITAATWIAKRRISMV